MACETIEHDGIFFALWGRPTIEDFQQVLSGIRQVVERRGKPVTYVSRVPHGAPPPDADVRRYVAQIMPEVLSSCSAFHVVLEGDGFVSALKRGVMVSIFQICRQRGTLFVHSSCDDVFKHVDDGQLPGLRLLFRRAREKGMLQRMPTSLAPARPKGFPGFRPREPRGANNEQLD